MPMRRAIAATATISALLVPLLAEAQETAAPSQELQGVVREIDASSARQAELAAEIEAAAKAQSELSDKLVNQARLVSQGEQALAKTEARMKKLKGEMAKISLLLAEKQDVLSEILAGLQRLEQNPPPALVVKPDDVLEALRSAMLFGAVIPEMRHEAEALEQKLAELESLRTSLATEASTYEKELAELQASRKATDALIAEKKSLAKQSRLDLEAERKRAQALADKAQSLKQLLASLAAEREKASAAEKAEEEARLAAERKAAADANKPKLAFSQSKGQLNYPAQGFILKAYGADSGLNGPLAGLVIATSKQGQVTAPADAKVEFAGPFRSYGQLIILNAGEDYLVLMAGMDQILAQTGQSVKAGEPVGVMGDRPAGLAVANGLTNQPAPVLYVEFRKNGSPVDPSPWWSGNMQEAMR